MSLSTTTKLEILKQIVACLESVAVAYSGGTDSTLLLKVAHDCLGDRVVALTGVSDSLPAAERVEAEAITRQIGVRHEVIKAREMQNADYVANTPRRCYFCKSTLFEQLVTYARQGGYQAIVDGSNADDRDDYRPGAQAAREWGVRSPLQEAGLTKREIRELARQMGLPNWDKPSAACLASRVPYGTHITSELLGRIEQAELVLRRLGLRQLRVRHHGSLARIEVQPGDFGQVLDHRDEIVEQIKQIGYVYVTLDLAGFRSGSMNEV